MEKAAKLQTIIEDFFQKVEVEAGVRAAQKKRAFNGGSSINSKLDKEK